MAGKNARYRFRKAIVHVASMASPWADPFSKNCKLVPVEIAELSKKKVDHRSYATDPEKVPKDDLFLCVRPVIALGQIFGCLPFGGGFTLNADKLPSYTRCGSLPFLLHTFVTIAKTVITGVLLGENLVFQRAMTIDMYRYTFMYVLIVIRQLHLWVNANKFVDMFRSWRDVSSKLWSRKEDKSSSRKFLGLLVLLFSTIFAENWLNSFRIYANERHMLGKNVTFLGASYVKKDPLWHRTFPIRHDLIELFSFVEHKIMLYSLAVLSILHINFVLAINTKFQALVSTLSMTQAIDWKAARQDYLALSGLVEQINDVMAVHMLYIMIDNLYYTTSLICTAIDPEGRSLMDGIYTVLAISYLLMRFLFFCIPAGNIYGASAKVRKIVQACPGKNYDEDAQRLERLAMEPTGINCFDLFTISRSFILGFFNGVFTLVIVMLQAGLRKNT